MPNHIKNILSISGNAQEVLQFIKGSENEQFIDFNKILPMPEELEGTNSPTRIISDDQYNANKQAGINNGITQKQHDELVQKYGHADWYSWCLKNWGTKWNAYDQYETSNGVVFQTAWSSPFELIQLLSKLFPKHEFVMTYADEDLGYNCGEIKFQGGKFIEMSIEQGSEEAILFANEIWENY